MASDIQATVIKTVQGVGYLSAFILSLVICVPMSMNQDQFKGRCLLFSTGTWQEKDGQFLVNWASQAYCNYTIFVAVIMFVISVIQFSRFVKFLRRGRDSSFFSAFVDVLVNILMCIMVLIAACFVSVGLNTWCGQMTKRFPTCSEAGGSVIDKEDGIDPSGFYFQMSVAQFGVWLSFTIWVMLLTFSVVKLCRYHHEENLRVSMAKERKRLLNEDLVSEVPVNPTNHQYGRNRRLMRNQNEDRFEEVTNSADDQGATTNQGLVNDNNEDYQVENSSFQQQHSAQNSISNANLVIESSNMEHNDGSLSSMASSQHSYNSLPKGNQIHIDQRPDLLK